MSFTIANDFYEDLGDGIHNFGSHNLAVALSNTAPASETSNPLSDGNGILSNVTQVAYTNYSDDLTVDRRLQSVTWTLSSGTCTLDAADFIITASGGALPDFQYIWLFNDSAASDQLIGVYDHGSAISLASGQSFNNNFDGSGIFSLAVAA